MKEEKSIVSEIVSMLSIEEFNKLNRLVITPFWRFKSRWELTKEILLIRKIAKEVARIKNSIQYGEFLKKLTEK